MGNYSIDESKVKESFEMIINYCKERSNMHASCLGCPIRKSYGTKQPEICKLHMIERPSDIK